METISKELALVLKDKGFNEETLNFYKGKFPDDIETKFLNENTIFARDFVGEDNFNERDDIQAPTEHQVINWIYSFENYNEFETITTKEDEIRSKAQWFEFWYTILMEHKFGLMYEFIGRLEEWFENNNKYIIVFPCLIGYGFSITPTTSLKTIYVESNKIPINYTKQQAKHEAILKCFKLMKGE